MNCIRLICILLLLLVDTCTTCVLVHDGWSPEPGIEDQAAGADVVLSGQVVKLLSAEDPHVPTYSAQVKVKEVLKGHRHLMKLDGKMVNVSGFGPREMCMSEVEVGASYVMFLVMEDSGRLAVRQDDHVHAALALSQDTEEHVLRALGLGSRPWAEWSSCSLSCGGGVQERQRLCVPWQGCDHPEQQRRPCNDFLCDGARDLLRIFNLAQYKRHGVRALVDRPGAYRMDTSGHLRLPAYTLFPAAERFPRDFAILIAARSRIRLPMLTKSSAPPVPKSGSYLLALTDDNGRRRLSLRWGATPELLLSETPSRLEPPRVRAVAAANADLDDGQWHRLAFAINGTVLQMYVDCELKATFNATSASDIPAIGTVTIGYAPGAKRQEKFEGDLEQLMIIPSPNAARQQCGQITKWAVDRDLEPAQQDSSYDMSEGSGFDDLEQGSGNFELEWSEWSECSATCGRGIRKRTSYCVDNGRNLEECIEAGMEKSETRNCLLTDCESAVSDNIFPAKPAYFSTFNISSPSDLHKCDFCLNGGSCQPGRKCSCPKGYHGQYCHKVACPGCLNGGKCVKPNVCKCADGFKGFRCQEVVCTIPCKNGGSCINPGVCSCPAGYSPPLCAPLCHPQCMNGGTCLSPNKCRCRRGYSGVFCERVVCEIPCKNGGRCVAPNKCACPSGFQGDGCSTPVCYPPCENGGTCVKPHVCVCPPNVQGLHCEKLSCNPECLNGGTCLKGNICQCTSQFTGKQCDKPICPDPCLNGGRCLAPNKCSCPNTYSGRICEKRKCTKYKAVKEPILRSYKKVVKKQSMEPCEIWGCTKPRIQQEVEYKPFYKIVYKCAD